MLAQRRKLLQYLRRADFDAYAKMLSALGLKDRYMKQVILCALLKYMKASCLQCLASSDNTVQTWQGLGALTRQHLALPMLPIASSIQPWHS